MVGDLESGGSKFFEPLHALVEVEDTAALLAVEVMVVALVGALVAWRLAGDLDAADLTLLLEVFQRSVNGGYSQGRDSFDGQTMDVIREQGSLLFLENSLDRLLLPGGASFDGQGITMGFRRGYFKPSTMVVTLCLIMES